ncbi:MAG TPA: cytochrome c peroxidase [Pyrinomonadaceae bacterium]|nr:cytochrome c peroxidase [Pyrinomonadaceae bacterium]
MRTLKVTALFLLVLALSLPVCEKLLPGFLVLGQTSSLSAPTDVIASDNAYSTKVGLTWDAIRGATLYRIFRNTTNDPNTATSVGTTVEGAFFDTSATPGQTFLYWVRAENGAVVSPLSQSDSGTRGVGNVVGPVLDPPPFPQGNPVTAAKAFLGKTLFWDEQLSSTRTVACGTCHFATSGGSDARSSNAARSTNPGFDGVFNTADDVHGSPGVPSNNLNGILNFSSTYGFAEQVTGRKSRSYIDAAYSPLLFWDGRASSEFIDPLSGAVVLPLGAGLESQVLGPPVSAVEMAHTVRDWNDVAARMATSRPLALSPSIPTGLKNWIGGRTYPELFQEVFGTPDVTPTRIALAIATFERTVYSDRAPIDAVNSQLAVLTPAENRGRGVFNGSGCNVCHGGPTFSVTNGFFNVGVRPQNEDTGRGGITGNPNQIGEFRVPSLRNVALRGPYFHNGSKATLTDVVEFYNRGGDFDAPNINHALIRPLNLSAGQKSDLIAFLTGALTDPRVAAGSAPFDRPTLYSESNRVPQITGSGVAGSGGIVPQVTALEPPILGNSSFGIGVSKGLGGAQAVLVINSTDPGAGPSIPATGSFARVSLSLAGAGAGQGVASVSVAIPNDVSLLGTTNFGRWYISDPSAPGGVAVTPAFRMTIFGDGSIANAIDDTAFFVTQNYKDFLSREPDASGLAFWTNEINSCGTNAACLDFKRQNVSAAFFLSIEFQETGFYAIRLQRAAFGKKSRETSRISFAQFLTDAPQIGAGVIVGQPGYLDLLEQNKQNYASQLVSSSAFSARFPTSQNGADYVNALYASAGVTPTQTELQNALTAFGAGDTVGRTAALRKVAESNSVTQAELNPSFVLLEYFGYLRRDPDAGGYNFWLGKLEQFNGNYIQSDMVKSFIVSGEYRGRFPSAP